MTREKFIGMAREAREVLAAVLSDEKVEQVRREILPLMRQLADVRNVDLVDACLGPVEKMQNDGKYKHAIVTLAIVAEEMNL